MCAQYTVEPGPRELMQIFDALFPEGADFDGDVRILPHQPAPVLASAEGRRIIQLMKFSLLPSWSKEPKVKFATHNARLSTFDEKVGRNVAIYEKPTWRGAFQSRPCLVPLNNFFEAAYRGPLEGHMVRFTPQNKEILMAAGIWESWSSKETGEIIVSFAIITDEPSDEIRHYGHDRCPVFLKQSSWEKWLNGDAREMAKNKVQFLLSNRAEIIFEASMDRPLKAGWEKRRPAAASLQGPQQGG